MIDLIEDVGLVTCRKLERIAKELKRHADEEVWYEHTGQYFISKDFELISEGNSTRHSVCHILNSTRRCYRVTPSKLIVRINPTPALAYFTYTDFLLHMELGYQTNGQITVTSPSGEVQELAFVNLPIDKNTVLDLIRDLFGINTKEQFTSVDFVKPYTVRIKWNNSDKIRKIVPKVVKALRKAAQPSVVFEQCQRMANEVWDRINRKGYYYDVYRWTGIRITNKEELEAANLTSSAFLPSAVGIKDFIKYSNFLKEVQPADISQTKRFIQMACRNFDLVLAKYSDHKIMRQPL